jgi:hypothetical protein
MVSAVRARERPNSGFEQLSQAVALAAAAPIQPAELLECLRQPVSAVQCSAVYRSAVRCGYDDASFREGPGVPTE